MFYIINKMFTSKNILILVVRNTIISLVVVLISLFSIFYIKNEIKSITDRVVTNNKLNSELKQRTELFSVIKQNAEIIGENENLIESAFIQSNDISLFTNTLDTLALKYKISQTYRFETPIESMTTNSFSFSTISYSNNFNTNIKTLSSYLKDFENLPYFTKIENLNISSQDKLGIKGPSTISLKATLLTKTTE